MLCRRFIPFAVVFSFLFVFFRFGLQAQSVTFSAQVGDTSLVVNGYSAPNSVVVFTENNAVIGTTTTTLTGSFSKTFTALSSGLFILGTYSIDANNNFTSVIQRNLYLIEFQELEINDVYLPPTINLTQDQDEITIDGYTLPNTTVEILINTVPTTTINVTSNPLGFYEYSLPVSNIGAGNFSINAFILDNINLQISTNPINFQIIDQDNEPSNPIVIIPVASETVTNTNQTVVSQGRSFPVLSWQALGEVLGERGVDYFNEEKIIPPIVISSLLLVSIIVIILFGIYRIFSTFRKKDNEGE